jgi:excisionase family DNA binding protein
MERLYRIREAAEKVAVSPHTMKKWVFLGKVRAERFNGCVRIAESALHELVQGDSPAKGERVE